MKTTMNEMLGWYGYDKINSKDSCSLQSMNLVKLRDKYNRGRSKSTEPETSSDEYNSSQSPTTVSSNKLFLTHYLQLSLSYLSNKPIIMRLMYLLLIFPTTSIPRASFLECNIRCICTNVVNFFILHT